MLSNSKFAVNGIGDKHNITPTIKRVQVFVNYHLMGIHFPSVEQGKKSIINFHRHKHENQITFVFCNNSRNLSFSLVHMRYHTTTRNKLSSEL